jgi:hypothetical protein
VSFLEPVYIRERRSFSGALAVPVFGDLLGSTIFLINNSDKLKVRTAFQTPGKCPFCAAQPRPTTAILNGFMSILCAENIKSSSF